jgi:hypothetical protein
MNSKSAQIVELGPHALTRGRIIDFVASKRLILARRSGCSPETIAYLGHDKTRPSWPKLRQAELKLDDSRQPDFFKR